MRDRTSDILKDPPKKYAFKLVRNAKLPSGRRVKMTPAPFSIFATGEFKEEERFDRTLRTYGGPEDFPKDAGGNPIDFQTRIHRDIMRRASEKILCGKTITPVQAHEVYGDPRWHSGGIGPGVRLVSYLREICRVGGVVLRHDISPPRGCRNRRRRLKARSVLARVSQDFSIPTASGCAPPSHAPCGPGFQRVLRVLRRLRECSFSCHRARQGASSSGHR